jgi:UDP-glucuronate decarboxylase
MKRILVTGGAGFIGSNLCERLLNDGNHVVCIDNLYTGSIENIKCFLDNSRFKFIKHDIIYPLKIEGQIDQIYNLACPASPPKYQKDPIYTLKVNFQGILNLLELAKDKNASILQSSTSEIYGEPEISPQHEKYRGNVNTIGIRSCYDEGKRVAETLMMDYHKQYKVDIRIARIFNTYGPKMDKNDGRVVSNFINQVLNNKNITLYGNGEQTRSFCYIDDQINGLIKLMNSSYTFPINIGNPHEITVKELANIITRIVKTKTNIDTNSIIIYEPLPSDDPTNRKPDITLAREILSWEPKYELEDGILKTVEYFKNITYKIS